MMQESLKIGSVYRTDTGLIVFICCYNFKRLENLALGRERISPQGQSDPHCRSRHASMILCILYAKLLPCEFKHLGVA